MNLFKTLVRPLLFQLDAERAHQLVFAGVSIAQSIPPALRLIQLIYGNRVESPISDLNDAIAPPGSCGVAAGFDKNGDVLLALEALGCPFVEVGTVTPRPQVGNERPRVFRLPADGAIINRMGFPSAGLAVVARNIHQFHRRSRGTLRLFINIGKNKETTNEEAWRDYLGCVEKLAATERVFVVNVSSPNTPGLRELQSKKALQSLLKPILESSYWSARHRLLIKLSPDEEERVLQDACEVVQEFGLEGLVLTNTTRARPTTLQCARREEAGGLSGAPLFERSLATVARARELLGPKHTIVGVGGIGSYKDVESMLSAGATITEVYSALVFEGPALLRDLNHQLRRQDQ